jgi:predicted metal-dependent hydrolase
LAGDELLVSGTADFLPRRVLDFLRLEARRRLAAAALAKASLHGLHARRVVVKDTRTRWGSCTADGTLMFSWRLVMAPPEVQDYVVAHEVAHLRHMDHSTRFWALVEMLTPYRRFAMSWLEKGGAGLMRIG